MRQLTSLDAQFLGVETSSTYGHVGGLAVYDPSTAPGGTLEIGDVCRMVSERLHMLPPFRWRLVIPWPQSTSKLDVFELTPVADQPE